jgi:hypothetical protein
VTPCASDPDAFTASSYTADRVNTLAALCHTCPHRLSCLQDALGDASATGIYGGRLIHNGQPRPFTRGVAVELKPLATPAPAQRRKRAA